MIEDELSRALADMLRDQHVGRLKEPIDLPTPSGAFPASYLVTVRPVVPDANILRNDILFACRHNQRTTLVNAANSGLLRLFCAGHVVREVGNYSARWASEGQVAHDQFLDRWFSEYLPLIRVVSDEHIPSRLLSPAEARRIGETDPDDVPSATLALLLGTFYLTNDRRAIRAVYGRGQDDPDHQDWVAVLKAGGDVGQLGVMFQTIVKLLLALGGGLVAGTWGVVRAIGAWPFIPIGILVTLFVSRMSPELAF